MAPAAARILPAHHAEGQSTLVEPRTSVLLLSEITGLLLPGQQHCMPSEENYFFIVLTVEIMIYCKWGGKASSACQTT